MGAYRVGAGIFAIDKSGNFLLLKRAGDSTYPHTWSVAGGSMEEVDCENLGFPREKYDVSEYWNCAVREVMEETSLNFLDVNNNIIETLFSESKKHTYKYMTFVVHVDNLKSLCSAIKLDLNENIDYKIFNFENLENLKRHSELDKHKKYEEESIHPGLYDVIEGLKNVYKEYIKKLK